MTKKKMVEGSQPSTILVRWLLYVEWEGGTHLQVLDVRVRGGDPDLLHHGSDQVVGLKLPAGEHLAALRAGHGPLGSPPVPGDAGSAEVVHAVQHDRVAEQVAAYGAGQILSQAVFRGWRNSRRHSNSSSSGHDEGSFPLQWVHNEEVKVKAWRRRKRRKKHTVKWGGGGATTLDELKFTEINTKFTFDVKNFCCLSHELNHCVSLDPTEQTSPLKYDTHTKQHTQNNNNKNNNNSSPPEHKSSVTHS